MSLSTFQKIDLVLETGSIANVARLTREAIEASIIAVEAANRIEGSVQAIEFDDYVELFVIAPSELVETTETVSGYEFNIVEIIQE